MTETPSRVASLSLRVGGVGIAAYAIGPALIQVGLVAPLAGFRIFGLGLLCGVVALILAGIGLLRTRAGSGRSGRGRALAGAAIGALLVGVLLVSNGSGLSVPPINDITTDPADPPTFVAALTLEPNRGRDMSYPGASFRAQQEAAYPGLAPLRLEDPPEVAFQRAARVARELGWEIILEDPSTGRLEAFEQTSVFRFVDDVAIRVRPSGTGAVIDVRSKSRDGRGDIGANAARIERFAARIAGDAPAVASD